MIANLGRILLASLGLSTVASTAMAQGNTFNPYGNSGYADYREFGNPMYSNNAALPGQALLNNAPIISRPRANSFQEYTNDLDGVDTNNAGARRAATSSLPYYQAYQKLNQDYNRVYRPNNTDADRDFYARQKRREQDYANAMAEKDPVKRAKLLRQVDRDSLDRPAAAKGATASATTGATTPKTGASTASVPRTPAPIERRQPAPSPFGTDAPRRANPAGTAPRSAAPSPTAPSPTAARPNARRSVAPDPSSVPTPAPR